ncbi:MAG: STAS domain-containing protein [Planctomycetes bacterium]|nr:STAS domain-containing protein [Planctomycetota bacterium]
MSIESWSDNILKVELQDDPAFSDDMTSLFEQAAANKNISAVLNFEGVNYLNSSNIAKLLKLRKKLLTNRGKMVICGISTNVWGLFLVTGLDKVFEFSDSVATGLAGVQLSTDK